MRFSQYLKPLSISLSPNTQTDDVWLAFRLVIKNLVPFVYHASGDNAQRLEGKFKEYQGAEYSFSVNSGRSALLTIMKALDIKEGDEVLLQAFTCNAVPNPVLWAGGTPIYVDIDDTLNIDPEDLSRKITLRQVQGKPLKAVIVQHTFGVPAQIDRILEIAKRHNLVVIEDCAHALGAKYNGKLVGTFGDVSFFSFGRDKVISSVWGGMITTNNHELAQKIEYIHKDLPTPSRSWTIKQLLHPLLFFIIIPTYYIFGKYLLAFLRVVRGVSLAVSQGERMGTKPDMFPARMAEALAVLALYQFNKLEKYNEHRREIAKLYFESLNFDSTSMSARQEGSIYLRFNIFHPNAKEIIKVAKRKHILLGDWYKNGIDPIGTDFEKMKYTAGSCPKAERAAHESVNLPTHINISENDALQIINFLKKQIKTPFGNGVAENPAS